MAAIYALLIASKMLFGAADVTHVNAATQSGLIVVVDTQEVN